METTGQSRENKIDSFVKFTPVPLAIFGAIDGSLICANSRFTQALGLSPAAQKHYFQNHLYFRWKDRRSLSKIFEETGAVYDVEVQLKHQNGGGFWACLSMQSFTYDDEPAIILSFVHLRPISDPNSTTIQRFSDVSFRGEIAASPASSPVEDHLLATLQARANQQAAVAHLGQRALASLELSKLFDEAVSLVARTLDVEYCKVLELMPNGHAFFLRAGVGWREGLVGYAAVNASRESQAGYTLRMKQPVIVEDLRVETRFSGSPLLHNHRIVSGVSVAIPGTPEETPDLQGNLSAQFNRFPATNSQSSWGILGVHTREYRLFTQDDVHFLEAVANVLASAIERHHSEEWMQVMKRAINSSNNGIVITDATQPNNPIIFANSGFERITGYSREEVLGKNCRFLQGKDRRNDGAINQIRQAVIEGKSCNLEIRNYRKDSTLFWNELSISPVHNAKGHLTHFIGIQSDITERKYYEIALHKKSQDLTKFISCLKDLHKISTRIYRSLEEMFAEYLRAGCQIFDLPLGIITELNGNNSYIRSAKSYLEESQPEAGLNISETCYQIVIEQRKTMILTRAVREKIAPEICACKTCNLESYIGTPIWVNGAIYGTLNFCSPQVRTQGFESLEREIIELMAQSIGRFIAIDKTQQKQAEAEAALRESEERYRRLVELSPEAIAVHSGGKFMYINRAGAKLLGASSPQEIIGQSLYAFIHPEYLKAAENQIKTTEHDRDSFPLQEQKMVGINGKIIDVEVAGIPAIYGGKIATQVIIRDITDRKQAEAKLIYEASHDALTHLPNRSFFNEQLRKALHRSKNQQNYEFALLFLDLDRFKVINDSLGHLIGDQLLVEIARRLETCVTPNDTIARLGGDEFTVLLENIESCREALLMAEKIHDTLSQPFHLQGHDIFTTVSIGIVPGQKGYSFESENPQNYQCILYNNPEDLLRDADIAMYRAKEKGRARYELFDLTMQQHTLALLRLETDLRQAIFGRGKSSAFLHHLESEKNPGLELAQSRILSQSVLPFLPQENPTLEPKEFVVYYQPIVQLSTAKVVGFEALVRWIHPTRGLVYPGEFIPLAEETGLIIPLGNWVLKQACEQLTNWKKYYERGGENLGKMNGSVPPLTISVNLSSKQLVQPNILETVDQILAETGCNPRCLKLEITESIIMKNVRASAVVLDELRGRGIQLSIDDFGTGYSSLSYLHQFPINTLKIDQSFVRRLQPEISSECGKSGQQIQIIGAIVTLAHNLDLNVIAEGIETDKQKELLQQLDCEMGQGYLFSKPLNSQQATEFLLKSWQVDQ